MDLPRDLIELLSAFAGAGVRYLLVGGLAALGAPAEIVEALRSARVSDIVWLGRPPTRIDRLQSLPSVEFADAWPRRLVVRVADIDVPVIGREDLIRNKRAVGRGQDLRDVRALTRATRNGEGGSQGRDKRKR